LKFQDFPTCVERCTCSHRTPHALTSFDARTHTVRCETQSWPVISSQLYKHTLLNLLVLLHTKVQ